MFGHRSPPVSATTMASLLAMSIVAVGASVSAGTEPAAHSFHLGHVGKSLVAPTLLSQTTVAATTQPVPYGPPPSTNPEAWCVYNGRRHHCGWRPTWSLGFEGGAAFTGVNGSSVFRSGDQGAGVHPGGSWGARVGFALFSWLGFEARYLGAYHRNSNTGLSDSSRILTSAGLATVRLTIPIPFVRVYGFAGIGVYGSSIAASGAVSTASMGDIAQVRGGVPLGVGIEVPLGYRLALGAEATYHRLFGGTTGPTAISPLDLATANAVLRFRL